MAANEALSSDLLSLGFRATRIRSELHPEGTVGYSTAALLRVGACQPGCVLCGIYRQQEGPSRALNVSEIVESTGRLRAAGSTEVMLHGKVQGGIQAAEEIIRRISVTLAVHGFTADDLQTLADQSHLSLEATIDRLQRVSLRSLFIGYWQSAAAQELYSAAAAHDVPAVAVLRCADAEQMRRSAERVAELQARLGDGITALVIWSDDLRTTAVDYLKAVALARLHAYNVQHVQVAWAAHGLKAAQSALHFGADDLGNAAQSGGVQSIEGSVPNEEELRRLIRDAGFRPARRDPSFRIYYRL
jgi:cyclic dehypoxanthinyl futalosine synthase